jgi:hypothetical protein
MRGIVLVGALVTALTLGVPAASAVPVTIQGTPGNDEIHIQASTPVSGIYTVNGVSTLFAGATTVTVEAGGGDDRISIGNPPERLGTFAPVLGVRVRGGDGADSFSNDGGRAAFGWLEHDPAGEPAGSRALIHGGVYVQRIILEGVEGEVGDGVAEPTWTYRGRPGADAIGLEDRTTNFSSPAGEQLITNTGNERVNPDGKGSVAIDSLDGEDSITLSGSWSVGPELVVDDGLSYRRDRLRLEDYGAWALGFNDDPANLKLRGRVLEAAGTFSGRTLAADVNAVELIAGQLQTRTDAVELHAGNEIHVHDADDVQVGGVWTTTSGVTSDGGPVTIETPGKLTVGVGEQVTGSDVTLAANGIDLNAAGPQAPNGTIAVRPYSPGVPVDLGAVDDPPGRLSLSDLEVDHAGGPRLEVGRADGGPVTVSAPVDRPTTTLAVVSGAGYSSTGAGRLSANVLELADGSPAGRTWSVDRSNVAAGGTPVPYRAGQSLRLRGGPGIDAFNVKANADADIDIAAGDPSAVPGDTLSYDAEGRVVSGDSSPPDGSIESDGVRPVMFREIESAAVVGGPGATGDVVIDGTPGADVIELIATTPTSGEYRVNGQSTQFTSVSSIAVNAGAGADTVKVTNPANSMLAPPAGIAVAGGADADTFLNRGGRGLTGEYQRAGGGAATLSHTAVPLPQRVALQDVESVGDQSGDQIFTNRGSAEAESIRVADQDTVEGSYGATEFPDAVVAANAATEVVDSGASGSTPDTVTLSGDYPTAPKLVIRGDTAEPRDTVNILHYTPNTWKWRWGFYENLEIRAGTVNSSSSMYLQSLAVQADEVAPLHVSLDGGMEIESGGDVSVLNYAHVGDVASDLDGLRSRNGSVSVSGNLILDRGETVVAGGNVDVEGGAQLDGTVSAPNGQVRLWPLPGSDGRATILLGSGQTADLALNDAEIDNIESRWVEVGAESSDLVTVNEPITRQGDTLLWLRSSGGFTSGTGTVPANAALLDAGHLILEDDSTGGRAWSVTPTGVKVDGGEPIPFGVPDKLSVIGGSGDDSFAVQASPLVFYGVHGRAGNDTLTYDAEGRATSGDTDPPYGMIESDGVKPVEFAEIESVFITP